MVKRGSLSEFQAHLAHRLAGASEQSAAGLLGVLSGNEYWLFPLSDAGEVIPLPTLTSVPLTFPWFSGIANIRGDLYAVSDFSAFRGQEATVQTPQSRLLLIGTRHGNNSALLVSQILGLRNIAEMTPTAGAPASPPWGQHAFEDKEGRHWKMLDVRGLLADERFMDIGL